MGRPNRGRIVDGVRLPDMGEGFFTREVWRVRGQRYGTDELVDLITGVARRVAARHGGPRLVVADLSGKGGGAAHAWHRSHQSGRDVDLLYFVKDANGQPIEPEVMHVVGPDLVARDGSGITIDIPRTWSLVREMLIAPEAPVQWVFMYQPIADALIAYAIEIGEPDLVIERARKACKQPGDSAPHHDHMHVRIYCSAHDRAHGCVDVGPMELLAAREHDLAMQQGAIAAALDNRPVPTFTEVALAAMTPPPMLAVATQAALMPAVPSSSPSGDLRSIQRLLRTGAYRVDLWRWR